MRIERFEMERTQCLYENEVDYNLSESGVLPLKVQELLDGMHDTSWLGSLSLKYPQSNGSQTLRERIGLFYGGTHPDSILVTNGGSEANYTALWALLEKGDRLACMIPNYLQGWGLGGIYGSRSDPFRLVERGEGAGARWALDLDSLDRAVSRRTKVILVTNPNNPSGAVLNDEEMDAVVRAARRVNAWLLVDEIYRGAEVSGRTTPSFWGRYDKLLITSGLSKAFGLPGLRIGWVVGPPKMIATLCSFHDYTTLTPTLLSDRLAQLVMEPARRETVLERTRSIIRKNLPRLESWISSHNGTLTYIPPLAGAIALVGYNLPISSTALFNRLRKERSVLITPGAHFGIGKYIRIGYGYDVDFTLRGLARIDQTFEDIRSRRDAAGTRQAVGDRSASVRRSRARRAS